MITPAYTTRLNRKLKVLEVHGDHYNLKIRYIVARTEVK